MEASLYIRVRGRVLGPYELEKLQSLVRRGQLSKMHEVSPDGATWTPASSYPELFVVSDVSADDRPPADGNSQRGYDLAGGERGSLPPASGGHPPMADERWYYMDANRHVGPVDLPALQGLLLSGQLPGETLVWCEGQPAWVPASSLPVLSLSHLARSAKGRGESAAGSLPPAVCRSALGARPWVLFLGIIGYVYAGVSLVGGIVVLIEGASKHFAPLVASGLFSMIYGVMAGVGGGFMTSYANRLADLTHSRSSTTLEKALDVLYNFWVYASVVLIVSLAFLVFAVIWIYAADAGSWRRLF